MNTLTLERRLADLWLGSMHCSAAVGRLAWNEKPSPAHREALRTVCEVPGVEAVLALKVGVSLMRELFGVMAADKIAEGVFATTSDFTPDAREFGTENNITLITARDFVEWIGGLPADVRTRILAEITTGDYTTPTCPKCDRKMVWKEKARFWGCPKFPSCRSKPIYPRAVKA